MRSVLCALVLAAFAVGCKDEPTYDVNIRLASTSDGGAFSEQSLKENTASLKNFPCEVSIRLGQCIDSRPLQMVFLKSDQPQARQTCPNDSMQQFLKENVGKTVTLGRGDGGMVWIQAFLGDDDDDSQFVDPAERAAYAELTKGTLELTRFDDDRLEGTIDAADVQPEATRSFVTGDLGAAVNDDGNRFAVGPRCTWPIMAKPN